MSNTQASYLYDKLGRLQNVVFNNGASATYTYDEAGNRSLLVEVPAVTPPPPQPTVTGLPKRMTGDFKYQPMVAMVAGGELMCWGDNTPSVLPNGVLTLTNSLPQRVVFDPNTTVPPSTATILDWAFTDANLYVVYSNGWVYSSGANDYGQLGHNFAITQNIPYLKRIEAFISPTFINITKVWAGGGYSTTNCAGPVFFQDTNYNMYGCGLNTAGELGNGTITNQLIPVLCSGLPTTAANHVIDVKMAAVSTFVSTYMLTGGTSNIGNIFVAGYNGQGQLALNSTANQTTGFVNATTNSGNVTGAVSISVNPGSTSAGNALYVDASGNVWTVGYNTHGELGIGSTTAAHIFTQVSGLSAITQAELGGGLYGFGYALNGTTNTLYTWGYNNNNNLFLNSGTTQFTSPQTVPAANLPSGNISKLWFSKSNQGLTTTQQLIVLTSTGKLAFAGANVGQAGISNPSGAFNYIAMPQDLVNGTDTIADLYVHGTGLAQRWFVLTANGNLYGCGDNTNSICTGGVAAQATIAVTAVWQPIILV